MAPAFIRAAFATSHVVALWREAEICLCCSLSVEEASAPRFATLLAHVIRCCPGHTTFHSATVRHLDLQEGKKALAALGLNIPQEELDQAFAAVETPRQNMEITYSDFVVGLCVLVLRMVSCLVSLFLSSGKSKVHTVS